ncbi:hypothetical protein SDC9_49041 [bioreactor metagenome]|uniref:Uncharacterized protein n=1 Tax=bioreactor metagenome TaxID=1076179 RepID=A0A644WFZ9_9ZZZZ
MDKAKVPWTKEQTDKYWANHPTQFPKMKAIPNLPAASLKEFGDLVAGDCTDYEGFIVVTMCGKRTKGQMVHVASVRARDFGTWLSRMMVLPDVNYYFSKSQSKNPGHWGNNDLFSLNTIIIDIDSHKKGKSPTREERTEIERMIVYAIDGVLVEDSVICEPNIVVHTGRGMQLIWLLESAANELSRLYQFVCESYIKAIKSLLSSDEKFKRYNVDCACSKRIMGLNRLPGTFNTATSDLVTFDIVHKYRMDLPKEYENQLMIAVANGFVLTDKRKKKSKRKGKKGTRFFNMESVGKARVQSLMRLLDERGATIDVGMRDQFSFILFNAYKMDGKTPEDALAEVLAVNNAFERPLLEKHLIGYLGTSMRKKYKMTNTYIIEKLEISQAEQAAINLFPTKAAKKDSSYKNAARNKKRREKRDERNSTVIELFCRGLNKTEIARKVGIARGTVIAIVNQYKAIIKPAVDAIVKETKEQIQEAAHKVKTTLHLAKTNMLQKDISSCERRSKPEELYNLYIYPGGGPAEDRSLGLSQRVGLRKMGCPATG